MTVLTALTCSTLVALGTSVPERPVQPARPATAAPSSGKVETLVAKVQNFYDRLRDFEAKFAQEYTRTALSRTSEQSGTLTVKKGGKVHWAYEEPVHKLYVADGRTLWIYEPEEQQVIVDRSFSTDQLGASLSFLWGEGQLTESFRITRADPSAHSFPAQSAALKLVPKTDRTYRSLVLRIDTKTGRVEETVLYETSGNTNRFRFLEPKVNRGVADARFEFVPPAGVDVIDRPS